MVDYNAMTQEIRAKAKAMLENKEVKYIIGWERGANSFISRPVIIRDAGDTDRLVWNPGCVDNLTRYLVEEMQYKPKRGEEPDLGPVGIIVKPCDSKSIVELIKENIVPRERVKIIAVTNIGTVETNKLRKVLQKIPQDKRAGIDILQDDNEFIIKYDGGELKVPRPELLANKCETCVTHNPVIHDVVIGDKIEGFEADKWADLAELESMSPEERWKFWEDQISKCVRCYACRDSCSLCYCAECVFDKEKPFTWIDKTVDVSNNMFYHLVRAMHLAGRCVDCGECERVCPVNIPIRKLNRLLLKSAKDRYKIYPGMNPEDKPMFGSYDIADPDEVV